MALLVSYNPPVDSSQTAQADPSSAALIAELDSTSFGIPSTGKMTRSDRLYAVNVWLGGSTAALWVVEQAVSTVVSTYVVQKRLRTASNQHSQFIMAFKLAAADRIRVRLPSTLSGSFEASLQAQEIG